MAQKAKKKIVKKSVKVVKARKAIEKSGKNLPAVIENQETSLSLSNTAQILEFGKVLNKYIKANHLSVEIEGKDYPLCGAWKFAGQAFGLTAIPVELIPQHKDGQYVTILYAKQKFEGTRKDKTKYSYEKDVPVFIGFANHADVLEGVRSRHKISKESTRPYLSYKCVVEVQRMSDDKVIGKGTSVCSNMETLKAGLDEFGVMGQAQTRTIARALKNLLDYVLNAADMQATPAEEMESFKEAEFQGEEPSKKTTVVKKQTPSEYQFGELMLRAKAGEKVLEKAKEHLVLTQEQIDALDRLENPKD